MSPSEDNEKVAAAFKHYALSNSPSKYAYLKKKDPTKSSDESAAWKTAYYEAMSKSEKERETYFDSDGSYKPKLENFIFAVKKPYINISSIRYFHPEHVPDGFIPMDGEWLPVDGYPELVHVIENAQSKFQNNYGFFTRRGNGFRVYKPFDMENS